MHTLLDFKGFAKAEVNLFSPLTVVIGPNGVGKTNLIEAIELLAFIASGQPLHTVTDAGRGGSFEVRGGLQSCARRPQRQFTLGFVARVPFEGRQERCAYSVTVRAAPSPEIESESLVVGGRSWFDARHRDKAGLLDVTYDNFARGPNKPTATAPAGTSVLSQYVGLATRNTRLDVCAKTIGVIRQQLQRAYVFDPSARLMRDYNRVGNTVLLRDGSNLSSVLYGLSIGTDEGKAALARIVDRIRHLPEEPFAEIGFETTNLNDVLFGFRAQPGGPLIDARLLSDGTLRTLAVLTALETCETSSRLVVEEFDNGVHPSRIAMLANGLVETATRRKLNVLVTTHNPATLDALSKDQLAGVLVCYWMRTEGVAAVTPLMDLPRVDELLERGRLGDLVTRRIVETYLQPVSEAERAAQVKAWLLGLP